MLNSEQQHEYLETEKLIRLFEQLFFEGYQTRLVRGGDEPLYWPARKAGETHQIIFARGYFNSALHELAHWCVAGPERRKLEDFGYWYLPDGRSAAQQRAFEKVEVRPQAYEQCFSWASGRRFHISADNLSGEPGDTRNFEEQVNRLTYQLLFQDQLQGRALILFQGICQAWQNPFAAWRDLAQQDLQSKLAVSS